MRLFHFVPKPLWPALSGPEFHPPSLASEGFVHLSRAHQLAGTLKAHFASVERVLLIEIDPKPLGADLRMEASRGGEDFPHLYRALRRAEILHGWRLSFGPQGLLPPDLEETDAQLALNEFWPRQ